MIEIRILGPSDSAVLERVAEGVFDGPVHPAAADEFLSDARHHIAVAIEAGEVVGMASAVDTLHPDKLPQLFINEVGVAPAHRRQGIARRLMAALLEHARQIGCTQAWLATGADNAAAQALYASIPGAEIDENVVHYTFRTGEKPSAE